MTIALNIIIGVLAGALVAWVANLVKHPGSPTKNIVTYALGIVFGALGAQAADQLLNYGPVLLGSSFIPAIDGGLVLSFIVLYAGKAWLHLAN